MFECHVRFERIFASKILTWAVAVTSLPGLLACRPWQAASGFVCKLRHSDCWEGPSSTHRGQGQVLVFQQQFWSIFAVFLRENLTA